jgi:flagellar motor switch/type III secretory pathway protein FliN
VTDTVSNWLPRDAYGADAVKAALAGIVADWSAAWFARHAVTISAVRAGREALVPARSGGLSVEGYPVRAELSESGEQHLLEATLDVDLSANPPNGKDTTLLKAVAAEAVEDLVKALNNGLEAGNPTGPTVGAKQINIILSVAGNAMMTLMLPEHSLVSALKARLGPPAASATALVSRVAALSTTRVVAEGLLGRAEIEVSDLKGLSAGDVLLLDRSLSEPVELRLVSGVTQVGAGKLGRQDSRVSIEF